jgi:hypothetical protein
VKNTVRPTSVRGIARQQERELRMAREAIALVAGGVSPRVVIAGIRYGEQILDSARRLGLASGVRVNPLRQPQRDAADLVVEPIYE